MQQMMARFVIRMMMFTLRVIVMVFRFCVFGSMVSVSMVMIARKAMVISIGIYWSDNIWLRVGRRSFMVILNITFSMEV